MNTLPASPSLSHLKKQAKHLLRDARAGKDAALARFVGTFPLAGKERELRLSDAQFVIAREYGFQSWTEMKRYVDWKQTARIERLKTWLRWAHEGNVRERGLAVRTLREEPDFFAEDAWLACTIGDEAVVRDAVSRDPGWVNRPGGPLAMPPLVAVTHSRLILEEGFEASLLACARLLLSHGAEVNGSWTDPRWPDSPLSALYGAAGRTHHAAMTKLLLEAGANPDDNESLYHSVESPDSTGTRLLLEAGARVPGTNAIGRVLDYDKLDVLQLLLQHGGDARERPWVHHAILRGRSLEHIRTLLEAGADPNATDGDGTSLYRWAQMHGRADVVALLMEQGVEEPLTDEEQFVTACAQGRELVARTILERVPQIFSRLTPKQLQALPQLADVGNFRAVKTMLVMGWPREVTAAWNATALNLAAYRGDAQMVELLLKHGADWRTKHGFGDNVLGTLSHASQNEVEDASAPRDYVGCARAIIACGVPLSDLQRYTFSPEVAEYIDTLQPPS